MGHTNHESTPPAGSPETIVVVGNGMVGHRFCTALRERDTEGRFQVVVFGEERLPAYDRVRMSEYFTARTSDVLALTDEDWYADARIPLHLNARVASIDTAGKTITTEAGNSHAYDRLVLATGSSAFVPPVFSEGKKGVFVYRTIDDLDGIIAYAEKCRSAVVIGGGLLGLEAAKAVKDLGLETKVVEFAPRLMPRQLDDRGSDLLIREINEQGVEVLLGRSTSAVLGNGAVTGLAFDGGDRIAADMVVISAGIRPRDELARAAGLTMGARGGVRVDDTLTTSDRAIHAIGEVVSHKDMVYGLVGPGYDMADILVDRLLGGDRTFTGADLSTKLKLLGVDVASFGDPFREGVETETVELCDPVSRTYKKVILSSDHKKVIGGILVGDTGPFGLLSHHARTGDPIALSPAQILGIGGGGEATSVDLLPEGAQICSCNNVTKGQICAAVADKGAHTAAEVKKCTSAGAGCGGCVPVVKDLVTLELKKVGITVKPTICSHFPMSRQELFHQIKVRKLRSFRDILDEIGTGGGCEVCKPAVASMLASLWNEHVGIHDTIQDTNDRFMANIQRQGTYSIVPRVPGGEITPDKLIVIGEVAKQYDLYCKITGGQRIDLLGARIDQLPEIWEKLIAAGFESGHAYGKSVRTVKSCVGKTWCRFGVQDSTAFAIQVENRYKGIRAPHKVKFAVSGCVRECAEAQCKDFGLIATEKGWNLYVCGNGGAKPRHADLFASDLDDDTVIRYIDRIFMYYIHTAEPLTRTSVWLEKLEGGLHQLQDVVIHDSLGICETLEADMSRLVDTYHCEWKAVVDDPLKRARFRHFSNSDKPDPGLTFVPERGQRRPADWVASAPEEPKPLNGAARTWFKVGRVDTFPRDGGMAFEYGNVQLAVFHYWNTDTWYATQNQCPHKQDMVLARGLLGEHDGTPKVACPLHKKTFSLQSGECLSGEDYKIHTFDVKVEDDRVYVLLPAPEVLEEVLGPGAACAGTCE